MGTTSVRNVEDELFGLEKKFWQAMKDGDVSAARKLTDFPCIVAGPQGIGRVDEVAFTKMMQSPKYRIDDVQLSNAEVRMLSEDVAVIAYKVHEKLTVDGKSIELEAADSSTWIRRNGSWVCALHSESLKGDPFGRQRTT
jgi:hypothetical protein